MENDDDKVGYCRPPKKNRFPKGKSGNPKGRPKKPKPPILFDDAAILRRLDAELIDVGGIQMSRREREVRGIFGLALKGDKKARRLIEELRASAPSQARSGVVYAPLEYWK